MHHPTDRITHTTAFVTPVVEHWLEREIAQWVHTEEITNANITVVVWLVIGSILLSKPIELFLVNSG